MEKDFEAPVQENDAVDIEFEHQLFDEITTKVFMTNLTTLHVLLSKKHGADALALYMFYYMHGKRQKTNQVYALPTFCKKGLNWGEDRFKRADKLLRELKLVTKVTNRDEQGKIKGWYVKLSYLKENFLESRGVENPPSGFSTRVEKPPGGFRKTNACNKNLNACNEKEAPDKSGVISPSGTTEARREELEEGLRAKRIANVRKRKHISATNLLGYYKDMLVTYGYRVPATIALDHTTMQHLINKQPDYLAYIELAIRNWKEIRAKVTWPGNDRSMLASTPSTRELWLSREAILQAIQELEGSKQEAVNPENFVTYTSENEVPEDHPRRKLILHLIKTKGKAEVVKHE